MTEARNKKRINSTLSDMFSGIVAFGVICQLTAVWFVPQKINYSLGLWVGIITALLYGYHLWWSLDRNLTINADNERGATAFSLKHSVLRYAAVAAVLIGLWYIGGNTAMISGFVGVMGIKIGAYLSPVIAGIRDKNSKTD